MDRSRQVDTKGAERRAGSIAPGIGLQSVRLSTKDLHGQTLVRGCYRKSPKRDSFRNRVPMAPLRCRLLQEAAMDPSVHQARWLLFPLFGLCFGITAIGFIVG